MSDYIKREEAEKIFVEYNCVKCHVTEMSDTNEANRIMLMFRENAKKLFSLAPSADVAEVVRCKDCVYYQDNNDGYPHDGCRWRSDETPDADDFCSMAERKDNG